MSRQVTSRMCLVFSHPLRLAMTSALKSKKFKLQVLDLYGRHEAGLWLDDCQSKYSSLPWLHIRCGKGRLFAVRR